MLDQIEEQEKVKDDDVAEIDSATHVVNIDFEAEVDIQAIIIVNSAQNEQLAKPAADEP